MNDSTATQQNCKRPWLRLWAEIVDDEKLRLLAFEDRWHFVAFLAIKAQGILDSGDDQKILRRKVAVKLGLQALELDEVVRRLCEVDLLCPDTLQPKNWAKRQFESDVSSWRVKQFRERNKVKRFRNVSETAPDTDTDTETEKEGECEGEGCLPKKPKSVATKIPADWEPNARSAAWLKSEGVLHHADISRLVASFRTYWLETGGRKANWDLAFQRNPIVKAEIVKIRRAQKDRAQNGLGTNPNLRRPK